jgi:hypothetical protein
MSFNNPLAFNLSKSTATTSTTNTNTTSTPPTSNEPSQLSTSIPKSPFLQTILTKSPSTERSPKFGASNFTSSVVAPTVLTIGDELKQENAKANGSNSKSELIGLFDKFDISKGKEEETESEDEELRYKESEKGELKESEKGDLKESEKGEFNESEITGDIKEIGEGCETIETEKGSEIEKGYESKDTEINSNFTQKSHEKRPSMSRTILQKDPEGFTEKIPSLDASNDKVSGPIEETKIRETNFPEQPSPSDLKASSKTQSNNNPAVSSKPTPEISLSSSISRQVPINAESMTIRPYNPDEPLIDLDLEPTQLASQSSSYENDKSGKDLSDITGEGYEEGVEEIDAPVEEYGTSGGDATNKETEPPTEISSQSTTNSPQQSSLDGAIPLDSATNHNSISHHISPSSVNPNEQHQQSHKPFNFQIFLTQLKKKSSDPIVRYIRSFLVSFSKKGHTFTADQRIKIITEFKSFMYEKFTMYEPFASMDDIDLENSREGLEKLIMNRLYDFCFPGEVIKFSRNMIPESYERDLKEDEEFKEQLQKFSWVSGHHLDVEIPNANYKLKTKTKFLATATDSTLDDLIDLLGDSKSEPKSEKQNLTFIDHAIIELSKINNYRAPRDKIICILNACKIIFNFLKLNQQETNADSFIPLLILIIIQAEVDLLLTNLHYIEVFRGEEWLLHGETSYYLSSIQGAITFVQNLSRSDLTISEEEYEAHMEAWEAEVKRERTNKIVQPQPIHGRKLNVERVEDQGTVDFDASQAPSHPEISPHEYPHQSLSPSNILMTSAEMFTKSISSFLSPSPQEEVEVYDQQICPPAHGPVYHPPPQAPHASQPSQPSHPTIQPATPQESEIDSELMKQTYNNLKEIFPNLDKSIMKDIILLNKGNMEDCVDACLELVGE